MPLYPPFPTSTTTTSGLVELPAASVNFKPSNPTGMSALTAVMMGIGSTCAYTPTGSGKVLVTVTATLIATTAATGAFVTGQYGTGTAPANQASVSGTQFSGTQTSRVATTSATVGLAVALTDRLALTPNTAYWFDLSLATNTNGDAVALINISVTIAEQLT